MKMRYYFKQNVEFCQLFFCMALQNYFNLYFLVNLQITKVQKNNRNNTLFYLYVRACTIMTGAKYFAPDNFGVI